MHLIISTQLDAPANWYYEVERLGPLGSILLVVNTAATVVGGGGMVVTSEVAMLGMLALGVFGVASVAGLATVFSIYFRKHSNRNEFNPQLLENVNAGSWGNLPVSLRHRRVVHHRSCSRRHGQVGQ